MNIIFFFLVLYCSGKADGLHALSSQVHDCRNYVNCTNEFHVLLTCPVIGGNPTYFNPNTGACQSTPVGSCDPGKEIHFCCYRFMQIQRVYRRRKKSFFKIHGVKPLTKYYLENATQGF